MVAVTLVLAVLLAMGHLLAYKLRFLEEVPRNRWLSAAGGVSVAYVFVHLLPELHTGQHTLKESVPALLHFIEGHAYLLALVGLSVFYGLEIMARHSRRDPETSRESTGTTSPQVFRVHVGSFAVYNALIGYLLLNRQGEGVLSLVLFAVAIGLHFMVNDYGLNRHHQKRYRGCGRWILAASVLVGWLAGVFIKLPEHAVVVLFAVLAGGIIMNVLKEEVPETQESKFWPFALGVAVYSVLLLSAGLAESSS